MTLRTAQRKKVKLKIGLSAPSGAGKTYSALLLARGLCDDWSQVVMLDSENGSGELYSHLGPYQYYEMKPPFDAKEYLKALHVAINAGVKVIIVDSMTHFWDYCLDYQNQLGGRFQDWQKANPVYKSVVDAILQAPVHVITCSRRKTAYEISEESGRKKVTKLGTKVEMRDSFEFELSVAFSLSMNHLAEAEKDRTGLFKGKPDFVISEKTGEMLRKWAESGAEPAPVPKPQPPSKEKVDLIVNAFKTLGVTREMIEKELGHSLGEINDSDLNALRDVYGRISSGDSKVSDHFVVAQSASDLNKRLKESM